ncbi:MAG: hypothetical protein QM655_08475 [Nocardioidaceae bacterium]
MYLTRRLTLKGLATALPVVAVASVLLAGCSGSSKDDAGASGEHSSQSLPTSSVNEAMISCMQGEGWTATMKLDGTISNGSVPEEQQDALDRSAAKCSKRTGWGDLAALTTTQRRELYKQEVAEHDCLVKLGLTPPEPPTEQTYLDTFQTADQYYAGALMSLTDDQVRECPPPTWFMNW